eukprot:4763649-Amphidinium_carterae.1
MPDPDMPSATQHCIQIVPFRINAVRFKQHPMDKTPFKGLSGPDGCVSLLAYYFLAAALAGRTTKL